ncbi:GNAT family N-acetyltransferase [Nitratireductor indicus]|uniref:Ribosomal-protein-alanine acetyltransferase n=1 Tax=Nitratireductor indicus C115 TaxID=1231190 RepID=K2PAT4_9HYPH|nr:GNAT family N-acetyltransferase [Nitratireductor indicus]EKF44246.1 ribosomal-protein-alanine acetyltransferase [Nitratireductor indicus C115]MDS1137199.1 GNAT family N-acetyltransferase [Nitratireductor indicus]SFQ26037.1 ribosomal-protein-alanine N-acetyltransferase [Nitratireductor indicus]
MGLFSRRKEFTLRPLEVADSLSLSDLHAEGFARPWSDAEFESLLSQDTVFGFAVLPLGRRPAQPAGFVLARQAADEGEILTIIVSRAERGQGLGRQLMDAVLRRLHADRAAALFLEVDETNAPAVALYRRLGFLQVGGRADYYRDATGTRTGALVMRRDLR